MTADVWGELTAIATVALAVFAAIAGVLAALAMKASRDQVEEARESVAVTRQFERQKATMDLLFSDMVQNATDDFTALFYAAPFNGDASVMKQYV